MPAPEFVSLADVLRAGAAARASLAPAVPIAEEESLAPVVEPPEAGTQTGHREAAAADAGQLDVISAAREARLFRARLADAFDDALARLLRELAADVLARELRLAPCDVAALARRVLESAPVVRVRVSRTDAGGEYGVPVVVDPELHPGDAVFELAGGALDARLGVRLAAVLDTEAVR